MARVLLVDERRPLSLTSDKSTEAYRNWWPGPDDAMVALMNRSIDLLEELADATGNVFHLNRRGYFYATSSRARAEAMQRAADVAAAYGAGPVRVHETPSSSYRPAPFHGYRHDDPTLNDGADLITDPALLRTHFGWMAEETVAVLHARRCGWFSGQQLGMLLLEQARAAGATLLPGRVEAVDVEAGAVRGVQVRTLRGDLQRVRTSSFLNAAGPCARPVGALLGVDLPLFSEKHLKIGFDDRLGAVPRGTGLVICEDPVTLAWDDETRAELVASEATRWLAEPMPAGVHLRPEGLSPESQTVLVLWAYHTEPVAEEFPVPMEPDFAEIALRGMSQLVPALRPYTQRVPKVYLDGGYYTKTRENRPLIGPLPVSGAFTFCGLSGYGLMAACAGGELVAQQMTGSTVPTYAHAFLPTRYERPDYRALLASWGDTGQL
jgi:glycine/D-amino acid oxidase-like deaminating enzyme